MFFVVCNCIIDRPILFCKTYTSICVCTRGSRARARRLCGSIQREGVGVVAASSRCESDVMAAVRRLTNCNVSRASDLFLFFF